jgi:hypothetical protein
VSYRLKGQGGKSMRAVTTVSDEETRIYLTKLHGKEVIIEGQLKIKGSAHSEINRILLNPLLLTADDVLEDLAGRIESESDKRSGAWTRLFYDVVAELSTVDDRDRGLISGFDVCQTVLQSEMYPILC